MSTVNDQTALGLLKPDAELIAACDRFLLAEADYRQKCEEGGDDPDFDGTDYQAAMSAVCALPATTLEGNQAKAAAVFAFYTPDPPEVDSQLGGAMWDIVCDLAEADTARRPATPALVELSPDAKLHALCAEFHRHQETLDLWNNGEADRYEVEAAHERWWAALREIIEIRACTLRGIKAKALVVQTAIPSFVDEDAPEPEIELALSLARDVLGRA